MTLKQVITDSSTTIVDLRTEQEFASDHLRNAINIPLDTIAQKVDKIKKVNAPAVVFYCRSGNRSGYLR